MKKGLLAVVIFGFVSMAAGGFNGGAHSAFFAPVAVADDSVQLIVKFRDVPDPSNGNFLKEFSASIGAPIFYVRPLAGGFHLLKVQFPPDAIPVLLRRFQVQHQVISVEPDTSFQRQ